MWNLLSLSWTVLDFADEKRIKTLFSDDWMQFSCLKTRYNVVARGVKSTSFTQTESPGGVLRLIFVPRVWLGRFRRHTFSRI